LIHTSLSTVYEANQLRKRSLTTALFVQIQAFNKSARSSIWMAAFARLFVISLAPAALRDRAMHCPKPPRIYSKRPLDPRLWSR